MRAAIVVFSMLGVVLAGIVGLSPSSSTVEAQGCYSSPYGYQPPSYGQSSGCASPSSGSSSGQPSFKSNP